MSVEWEVWAPEGYIMIIGTARQVTEEVEEKLADVVGFSVPLTYEEAEVDGEEILQFQIASGHAEKLTEEQLDRLDELNLIEDDAIEENHKSICKCLGITVVR